MADGEGARDREASRRLAEELEATGIALAGDVGVEMLVRAADIRDSELNDPRAAMVLLRRVLKDAPGARLAIGRALSLAQRMEAHEDLADLLALAARATEKQATRARLVVRRADVLATNLGRIAEARGLYREAARLSPHTPLSADAERAADRIDDRLAAEREGRKSRVELSAVETGPLRFEETSTDDDPDEALEQLRHAIGARAPLDQSLVEKAIELGLSKGLYDVAARVLPWMSIPRRVALLDEIASGADGAQDPTAADRVRAAAFADAPQQITYFEAMVRVVRASGDEEGLARALERRAAAAGPDGLLALSEHVTDGPRRIRVLVELVRNAIYKDSLEETLAASERLAKTLDAPRLLARVLAAGASHTWLPGPDRGAILMRLARVLREDVGDSEGARVVEREAKAMLARGPDTQPDSRSPLADVPTEPESGFDAPTLLDPKASPFDAPTLHDAAFAPSTEEDAFGAPTLLDASGSQGAEAVLGLVRQGRFVEASAGLDGVGVELRAEVGLPLARLARVGGDFTAAERALISAWEVANDDALRAALTREAAALARVGGPWCDGLLDVTAEAELEVRRDVGLAAYAVGRTEVAARFLEGVCAEDPDDAEVAAALVDVVDEDRAQALAERFEEPSTNVLRIALARRAVDRGDGGTGVRLLRAALSVDPGDIEAAKTAFELSTRFADHVLVDEALRCVRMACVERQDRIGAFLASAVLVARSVDDAADRMTYEAHRHELEPTPRAPVPPGWIDDLEDRLEAPALPTEADEAPPLAELSAGALEAVDAVRTAFEGRDIDIRIADDVRVRSTPPRWAAVPSALLAYPRRLRFDLARSFAALTDPRLLAGLSFAPEEDEAPPAAVMALDRAGLIAVQDPALALAEVGPRTARGLALTRYALSERLLAVWTAMGLGL